MDRVFEVRGPGHFTLNDLALRNGTAGADAQGGALVVLVTACLRRLPCARIPAGAFTTSAGRYRLTVERWPVTIAGVFLTASTSHNEFGQRIDGSSGSGVFHTGSLNTVRVFIASCMVVNNSAVFAAGLANCGLGAVMAVTDSAIASNVAANQGGGIYNWGP